MRLKGPEWDDERSAEPHAKRGDGVARDPWAKARAWRNSDPERLQKVLEEGGDSREGQIEAAIRDAAKGGIELTVQTLTRRPRNQHLLPTVFACALRVGTANSATSTLVPASRWDLAWGGIETSCSCTCTLWGQGA